MTDLEKRLELIETNVRFLELRTTHYDDLFQLLIKESKMAGELIVNHNELLLAIQAAILEASRPPAKRGDTLN